MISCSVRKTFSSTACASGSTSKMGALLAAWSGARLRPETPAPASVDLRARRAARLLEGRPPWAAGDFGFFVWPMSWRMGVITKLVENRHRKNRLVFPMKYGRFLQIFP